MNGNAARFLQVAASTAGIIALGCVMTVRAAKPAHEGISLPTDWSHQHVVFSRPATPEMAQKLSDDPRYVQQVYRRAMGQRPLRMADGNIASPVSLAVRARNFKKHAGLWSIAIGSLTGSESPGAGNYPAKFSFSTETASCTNDFVVYSTGVPGDVTHANIVAFNNLYSGCGGTVPNAFWAYNTTGTVDTSPALSLDGTQIAFAQTTAGVASLVLLKWAPGTGTLAPGLLTFSPPATYRACAAPCFTEFALVDNLTAADDTTSSVFIDFSGDIAWVGDSLGFLHKFTGVFKGTPAEAGTPFPVQARPANPGNPITSPVFDSVSGLVFVGDTVGSLFSVNASTGGVQTSSPVGAGVGLVESPIVDSAAQQVFTFSAGFNLRTGTVDCSTTPCAAVSQFATTFIGGDTGNQITVGNGSTSTTSNPMYIGAFDSAYLDSAQPRNGNMYVCGNTAGSPTLYQIEFTNGRFASAAAFEVTRLGTLASTAACSPVTDFFNSTLASTSPEHMYVSIQSTSRAAACFPNGCLTSFIDTPWQPSTNYAVGQQIVDTNLQVETVMTAGKSGAAAPTWPGIDGLTVTDGGAGGVTWIDQGFLRPANFPPRVPSQAFPLRQRTIDTNGNFEIVTTAGTTSGNATITWATVPGATTTDGTVIWTNAGSNLQSAMQIPGGTTGVIIDNSAVTPAGGSQVYFGTLANQTTCSTSATAGTCAVQASQSALQ